MNIVLFISTDFKTNICFPESLSKCGYFSARVQTLVFQKWDFYLEKKSM